MGTRKSFRMESSMLNEGGVDVAIELRYSYCLRRLLGSENWRCVFSLTA